MGKGSKGEVMVLLERDEQLIKCLHQIADSIHALNTMYLVSLIPPTLEGSPDDQNKRMKIMSDLLAGIAMLNSGVASIAKVLERIDKEEHND